MANTKLIFCGNGNSENHELQVYAEGSELFLCVDMKPEEPENMESYAFIKLDRDTAIKLQKEIRKQISFMEEV